MTLEIQQTETVDGIEVRHLSDGSVEAQYRGKTSSCSDGFVYCAIGRVMYWHEIGRPMKTEQCLNEPHDE